MIFLPVRISNHLLIFAECWLIAGIFYVTYIMIKALIHKRQSSIVMMTAFIIFSIAIINDILYAQNLIQSIYLSPLGFFLFLIMQSQMLVRRFTLSFTQRELLAQSRDKFRHASITDSLTGLYNVRYLCEILDKEMLETLENKRPLSIIMADVDNFKNYNDTWGHKQGDELLKRIAEILSTSARDKDSPCRYGGEEFAIVFPNTLLNDAWEVSERIRLKFESVGESDPRMTGITVSVGVAQYIPGETADSFIERADKALYKAKNNGKNRVEMAF
jgi:diguanylate cyclase (GGDEF)-like protein